MKEDKEFLVWELKRRVWWGNEATRKSLGLWLWFFCTYCSLFSFRSWLRMYYGCI